MANLSHPPNTDPRLALWVLNMGLPATGLNDWLACLDRKMAQARAGGAKLLCLPEFISESWFNFAPESLPPDSYWNWALEQADIALPCMAELTEKHDIALLAGSMLAEAEDGVAAYNRAWFLAPEIETICHDKICLTPNEKNDPHWPLTTGKTVHIFDWQGWRLALLTCLDIELPALSALLAAENIDLLLVPSMTRHLSGWSRVSACARARAVEIFSAVALTGCCGLPRQDAQNGETQPYMGGAAVYLPAEMILGGTGILREMPPTQGETDPEGPLLITPPLPLGRIRRLRQSGRAEVWPGAVDITGISFRDHTAKD